MTGRFKKRVTVIFLLFFSFSYSSELGEENKKLTDRIEWLGFLSIQIEHGVEYYSRNEINIIYHENNRLKIHSILKSSNENELQIDTVFDLSGRQIIAINDFGRMFESNAFPKHLILAGTNTKMKVSLSDEDRTLSNKSDFSLILNLLSIE